MTMLLFIGVLQCLAVLRCCDLFVSGRLNIIEHERLCERLDNEEHDCARERSKTICMTVVTSSNVASTNFDGGKYFNFKRATVFVRETASQSTK